MLDTIDTLFPREQRIPEQYRIIDPLRQDYYLSNGVLQHWDGPLQEVLSPVWVESKNGCRQQLVGETPLLTPAAALETLAVAVTAYDNGRGVWPTMSVGERIKCVQHFTAALLLKKQAIVTLLQWEIGKSLLEAEREFDRTVVYIKDTIEALKELDRASSRFVIHQGIIGQIRRAPLGVVLCMGPYNFPLYENFTTLIPADIRCKNSSTIDR
jgi:glyceraldehyde-3-phosphate dehydrogenase (NADP+)